MDDSDSMLEPMNNPAMMMPMVSRLMIFASFESGASLPRTSMFILSCPRVSILSASPENRAASSMPFDDERSERARSSIACASSPRTLFERWMCALMMDTTLSLGVNGAMVPSSVTMPRETLVMDAGNVTLHERVSKRMSLRNMPMSMSATSQEP